MFATSSPLILFLQGTKMKISLNLSTTTNRYPCPFLVHGKPPRKCMEMLSHGLLGTCRGWYKPYFKLLRILLNVGEFRPKVHPELTNKNPRASTYQSLAKVEGRSHPICREDHRDHKVLCQG
jgi:hypothetical protein